MIATLRLKKGKEASLSRFHPWVFSGAIQDDSSNLAEGELVRVTDHSGKILGYGDWQIGSIAVRMLSFGDIIPDRPFISETLRKAVQLRIKLGLIGKLNNTCRLVHGEGDFMPGLIVDLYNDTAVVQAHSVAMHERRTMIAEILAGMDFPSIRNVFYKSETTLPFKANLSPVDGYLIGGNSDCISLENGLKFRIDWLKGQKTGFFIDQRENRMLLEKYSTGRKVLNMFCYTGGFSVYALRGGAEEVTSVDSSAKAIAVTRQNIEMNFEPHECSRHNAVTEDAFKYLDNMPRNHYDLIILDPPAFAKHRQVLNNALRGYQKLNARAFDKIASGGFLFTFSCSQAVSKEQFRLAIFSAAAETGRKVRILHQLTQPADHPVNIYHPEGEYLKGLILYVE